MATHTQVREYGYRTILALSSFEGEDWLAIDRAALLARRWNGRLIVLKVNGSDQLSEFERRAIKERIERRVDALGPAGPIEVTSGAAYSSEAVLEAARKFSPNLVVIAPSVVAALGSLVDTAPEALATGTRCPVLVARSGADEYTRGLMATDLSRAGEDAVEHLRHLDLVPINVLTVLHAYSPLSELMVSTAGVDPKEVERVTVAAESRAFGEVTAFIERCGLHGKVVALTSKSAPATAVLEAAEAIEADLIILGTSRRGGLARFLMGSTVSEVLAGARCDVLVAPGPSKERT